MIFSSVRWVLMGGGPGGKIFIGGFAPGGPAAGTGDEIVEGVGDEARAVATPRIPRVGVVGEAAAVRQELPVREVEHVDGAVAAGVAEIVDEGGGGEEIEMRRHPVAGGRARPLRADAVVGRLDLLYRERLYEIEAIQPRLLRLPDQRRYLFDRFHKIGAPCVCPGGATPGGVFR